MVQNETAMIVTVGIKSGQNSSFLQEARLSGSAKEIEGSWRAGKGLWLGLAGLVLGTIDTIWALSVGFEFRIGGQDGTLFVGCFLAISFGLFGVLLGIALDSRQKARAARRMVEEQMTLIASFQARIAHHEKLASLGQLAAAIAHEVRNPLAIIRAQVQNLAETPEQERVKTPDGFSPILEEIDRLSRVIGSLVRFAKPVKLDKSSLTIDEILRRTELLAGQLLRERDIRLRVTTSRSTALIPLDEDLLCQILLGLLDNAAHASEPGETVVLAGELAEREAVFYVADRGAGVAEHLKEKIFEPFFTTRENGNGLGLAVARQIASAHGGQIEVSDEPGGGARFSLRIPVIEDSCAQP